jgi:hypothetical protein
MGGTTSPAAGSTRATGRAASLVGPLTSRIGARPGAFRVGEVPSGSGAPARESGNSAVRSSTFVVCGAADAVPSCRRDPAPSPRAPTAGSGDWGSAAKVASASSASGVGASASALVGPGAGPELVGFPAASSWAKGLDARPVRTRLTAGSGAPACSTPCASAGTPMRSFT